MNAEKMFLGQILLDNDVYYQLSPKPWWFTDPKNRKVFFAIEKSLAENNTADSMTVGMNCDSAYVASLTNAVFSSANAKYYAELCAEAGKKEELRKLVHIISDKLKQSNSGDILSEIDELTDRLVSGGSEYKIEKVSDLMLPVTTLLEERYKNRGMLPGIQTGFDYLDNNILMGLQDERLYVIGGRPSQGKSALLLNIASFISGHTPAGFISVESGWREMLVREISSVAEINSQNLITGYFSKTDFDRLTDAAGKIYDKQLYIYDKPNASLQEIVGQARRMVNRYGCKVVFIDYLQIINVPEADNRIDQVGRASTRLKDLSRELRIPIVEAAQLRRDSDGRRPTLGDFQHSSQIEQDADCCMLIYHKIVDSNGKNLHKVKVEDEQSERDDIYLLVDKNRDGKTGAVKMDFHKGFVKFTERVVQN